MPHYNQQSKIRWSLKKQRDACDPWPSIRPGQLWEVIKAEPEYAIAPLVIGDKILITSVIHRSEWEVHDATHPDFVRCPYKIYYSRYGVMGQCSEILFRRIAKLLEW